MTWRYGHLIVGTPPKVSKPEPKVSKPDEVWHCSVKVVNAPLNEETVKKEEKASPEKMRTFESGATRNSSENKLDFEGFLSPLAFVRYAEYMHKNSIQADGEKRKSDNWQKGMPVGEYMKSLWRHLVDVWVEHRASSSRQNLQRHKDALCGVIFNAFGYLHELEKEKYLYEPEDFGYLHELEEGK